MFITCDISRLFKSKLLAWFGGFLSAIGILLLLSGQDVFIYFRNKELQITPKSTTFKYWRSTPVPMSIDIYFFNWTNWDSVHKEKPAFTEMGPYRFYEKRTKKDLVWNDNNDTVSFRQTRHWFFDQDHSNGTLDDIVTTINVIPLTAVALNRHLSGLDQALLANSIAWSAQKIRSTRTVGQFLFDGYTDDYLYFAQRFVDKRISHKFGWFYKRNGTDESDGLTNMATGKNDISRVGQVLRWNGAESTGYFDGQCGHVEGSTGEVFSPGITPQDKLNIFTPDLCSAIQLGYKDRVDVEGVEGLRFAGGAEMLDSGYMNEEKSCFCKGECPPAGVLNLTQCRYGAPIFISYPHFFQADPQLLENVTGLNPDPEKHEFTMTVEPTLGTTIDFKGRFQVNLLMRRHPYVWMYSRLKWDMYMPVMWFDERATLSEELADELKLALHAPLVIVFLSWTVLLLGLVITASAVLNTSRSSRGRCS